MPNHLYDEKLAAALGGISLSSPGKTLRLTFTGGDAGLGYGDIHQDRIYEIDLQADESGIIDVVSVHVVGELISPCSGYAPEQLDEFDWIPVTRHCIALLGETIMP